MQCVQLGRIRFQTPIIMLGGVLLYDLYRRRILHSCNLSAATVNAVLQEFAAMGRHPQLYRRRGNEVHIYYTQLTPGEEKFIHRTDPNGRTFDQYYHRVSYLRSTPAIFFSCQGPHAIQSELAARLEHIPGIRVVL